ncbi:cytoplasmic tRNA 2-thiolation protein 2-B-like [Amphibalanus amphitrite]|uniref:cytoplasmic tRNA 2-thiolation protein 2-B-like n=1 Tax=Amphibalanus amphitrite TaxID=1232801 RepID=UPI001C91A57B|nr:cytoplasmic tRNA 2-thiolation protein 2-B-like [Amphibalanus amphitrite]XP_043190728.1 cytoplasmic tRNA 2-thiolation protein 2-B-like [Amphibalanus amphitrite]XP_043190729.1 cytoplasmic tRNA 2-thiolation protein 2-B-like [Amphibalanus amphitrite]XP_043190730.1 cytoplasmic tRNA 2-thiolation protein 2-B-like [Amphibalanus amphitrite]
MCSIEEGDLADLRAREEAQHLKAQALSDTGPTLCQKCRSAPAVLLLRVNDIYCRDCFVAAFTHKFRSTLGKSRLLRPDEPALVAFSGGVASSVLARLVSDGASQTDSKRLRLRPGLLMVDESAVVPEQDVKEMERLAGTYRVPVYRAKLEAVMGDSGAPVVERVKCKLKGESPDGGGDAESLQAPPEAASCDSVSSEVTALPDETRLAELRVQLQQLWSAAGSGTAREQLLERLRSELLARAALQLGIRLLLLADTETRLAVSLLSGLAGGRGAHAHQQTALADRRHGERLLVLRPLRELSSKQVALFAHHCRVQYVPGVGPDTMAPASASIGRATEEFVLGLQASFPATVSTVYRTGTKLSAVGAMSENCALCRLPLDTSGGAASALQATRFSQMVSSSGPDRFQYDQHSADTAAGDDRATGLPPAAKNGSCSTDTPRCVESGGGCCGGGGEGCGTTQTVSRKPSRKELLERLCYGCQLVMKDMKEVDNMPAFVTGEVAARARRENMRKEIQDFLIEDS